MGTLCASAGGARQAEEDGVPTARVRRAPTRPRPQRPQRQPRRQPRRQPCHQRSGEGGE